MNAKCNLSATYIYYRVNPEARQGIAAGDLNVVHLPLREWSVSGSLENTHAGTVLELDYIHIG